MGEVDTSDSIDYRQWSMKSSTTMPSPTVTHEDAATWAGWFKALGDPTQILILNLLATEARPMTTGEVVEAMDVGQSAVSHHLQILGGRASCTSSGAEHRAGGGSTTAASLASPRRPS